MTHQALNIPKNNPNPVDIWRYFHHLPANRPIPTSWDRVRHLPDDQLQPYLDQLLTLPVDFHEEPDIQQLIQCFHREMHYRNTIHPDYRYHDTIPHQPLLMTIEPHQLTLNRLKKPVNFALDPDDCIQSVTVTRLTFQHGPAITQWCVDPSQPHPESIYPHHKRTGTPFDNPQSRIVQATLRLQLSADNPYYQGQYLDLELNAHTTQVITIQTYLDFRLWQHDLKRWQLLDSSVHTLT